MRPSSRHKIFLTAIAVLSITTLAVTLLGDSPDDQLLVEQLSSRLSVNKGDENSVGIDGGRFKYQFRLYGAIPNFTCPKRSSDAIYYVDFDPNDDVELRRAVDKVSVRREVVELVETSILFDFSPLVNDHIANMFAGDVTLEKWFKPLPIQASCLLLAETDMFQCALRVWFHLESSHDFVKNRFQDSFLYTLQIDRKNMSYVPNSGRIIGIPSSITYLWQTGPEDPRLILLNGSIFLNFVQGHSHPTKEGVARHQFLWSMDANVLHEIEIDGYPMNDVEKNWSPLVMLDSSDKHQSSLNFVYQLLPFVRMIHCPFEHDDKNNGRHRRLLRCSFKVGKPDDYYATKSVKTRNLLLRGGSPFARYEGDYYLAVTHTVQIIGAGKVYAAQLTLMHVPSARVVFVSSPIFVDPRKMQALRQSDASVIRPFFYPRSVLVESSDSLIIAGGINDAEAFIVRLRGIASLFREVIDIDKKWWNEEMTTSCQSNVGSSAYDRMLLSAYTSLEDWIRNRNLGEINLYMEQNQN